jgi:hypothetical protein
MEVFVVLLIFIIFIVTFYLIKKKIDEGTFGNKEKKQFQKLPNKASSMKMRAINTDTYIQFMNKKKDLIDKILTNIFTIDGFTFIVCFIIAPLMHVMTGKTYVGVVIFLIGLFGYAVHHLGGYNKK